MKRFGSKLLLTLILVFSFLGTVQAATYPSACFDGTSSVKGTTLAATYTIGGTTKYWCGASGKTCNGNICFGHWLIVATVGPSSAKVSGYPNEPVASGWAERGKVTELFQNNVGKSCDIFPNDGFEAVGIATTEGWCAQCSGNMMTNYAWEDGTTLKSSSYNKFRTECGASSTCHKKSSGTTIDCGNYNNIACTNGNEVCATSCTSLAQCKGGFVCRAGVCQTDSPPSTPALISPADEAELNPGEVTFNWGTVADPDGDLVRYDLKYDKGDGALTQSDLVTTSYTIEAKGGESYSWQVRACGVVNPDGVSCSDWSEERSFSILEVLPEVDDAEFNVTQFEFGEMVECSAGATIETGQLSATYIIEGPNEERLDGGAECQNDICSAEVSIEGQKGEWSCRIVVNEVESGPAYASMINTPPQLSDLQVTESVEIGDEVSLSVKVSDLNPEDTVVVTYEAWNQNEDEHYGEMDCEAGECTAAFFIEGHKGEWTLNITAEDGEDESMEETNFEMENSPPIIELYPIGIEGFVSGIELLSGWAEDPNVEDEIESYSWEISSGEFELVGSEPEFEWDTSLYQDQEEHIIRFNATSTDGITISESAAVWIDNQPPEITNLRTEPEEVTNEMTEAALAADVTDLSLETVLIESNHTGELANYTLEEAPFRYEIEISGPEGALIEWRIWANDTVGNWIFSELQTLIVEDVIPPTIESIEPESGMLPYGTETEEIEVTTDEVAECRISNSTTEFSEMDEFDETDSTFHRTVVALETEEENWFFVRCQDPSGNTGEMEELYYTVDTTDHTPPELVDYYINPAELWQGDEFNITFIWTDYSGVESVEIWHNASGEWENETVERSGDEYSTTIAEGIIENRQIIGYNSTAVDSSPAQNRATTEIFVLVVNNHIPTVPELEPVDDLYNINFVLLNWTEAFDEDDEEFWYEIELLSETDEREWRIAETEQLVQDLQYGESYTWKVRACDETDCSNWSEEESFSLFDTLPARL